MATSLSFLKDFKKKVAKMDDVITSFAPPSFWFSSGNYALNKIFSGSYYHAFPQGRITALAGPSGCLPASETVNVYVFKSKMASTPIQVEGQDF